jgi:hypothetical protein
MGERVLPQENRANRLVGCGAGREGGRASVLDVTLYRKRVVRVLFAPGAFV